MSANQVKEWERQAAQMRLARLRANVEQHLQPHKDREQIAREIYAKMENERLERLAASQSGLMDETT